MGSETEWFEAKDRVQYERCYWRRVGFAVFFAIAMGLILLPLLSGCASAEPENRICFMQFLGKTESGWTVAATQCMTPEAFAESQK